MSARNQFVVATVAVALIAPLVLGTGCSSSGGIRRSSVYVGVGMHYRHYYGSPWAGYVGPIIEVPPGGVGPGGGLEVDPDWGVEPPGGLEATPLPDMGMPDDGGDIGMGMEMMDMMDMD